MAGASTDSQGRRYACKCLNIRIQQASSPPTEPDFGDDPDFTAVYSGEEGINVEHTELTVRTRTPGQPIAGSPRSYRYTTITCLVCDILVYRVYQTYTGEPEGKDGPVLPDETWVERDVMKSLSGWIQVHKNCLDNDELQRATFSKEFSSTFSILLPPPLSPSAPSEPIFERPPSPSSISPPPPPPQFLTSLRPVFLPPPFTPSHPVFMHLSSLATKQSEALREAAERHMLETLQAKTSEIEQADAELRKNVDRIWRKFREGVARFEEQLPQASVQPAKSRSKERRMTSKGPAPLATTAPKSTREFRPAKEPIVFSPSKASSVAPPSGISQSLKTTSFHHPRAQRDWQSSPSTNGSSSSSDGTSSSDIATAMPPLRHRTENIMGYNRAVDEDKDTATSYRFFVINDEDTKREMKRRQQLRSESARAQGDEEDKVNGASNTAVGSKPDESSKQASAKAAADKSDRNQDGVLSDGGSPSGSREKGKPKRKVTFDIQPAVVTIKREVNAEKGQSQKTDDSAREMIFDFEDADENSKEQSLNFNRQPQIEQPPVVARPRKSRQRERDNLSTSFSGLRPASLPAPSNIRPPRSQHGSDTSSAFALALPSAANGRKDKGKGVETSPTILEEDTPVSSEPTGEAANSDNNDDTGPIGRRLVSPGEDEYDPEEEEDEQDDPRMYIGSMPIEIKKYRPPPPLTLASYRVKSKLAEKVVEEEDEEEEKGEKKTKVEEKPTTSKKPLTSEKIRKAEYAERDRSRSVDPGEFQTDTPDAETEDEIDGAEKSDKVGELTRGRTKALKILQARSEVPEEGMWRSLA